jgi:hypothetical protein
MAIFSLVITGLFLTACGTSAEPTADVSAAATATAASKWDWFSVEPYLTP